LKRRGAKEKYMRRDKKWKRKIQICMPSGLKNKEG